ncbi:MAG: helix-turn-helix domain-containing protein [Ruminococcaceae bacterium]|nr:helix-turn-helix domain-containing protein [Oscillospiraceae bacterium]
MEIGTKIKQLRFKAGLTQDQLATKLGISAQSVSKWETAVTMPDISLLPMLASELGATIDELFDLTAEQKLHQIERRMDIEEELSPVIFREYEDYLKEHLDKNENRTKILSLLAHLYHHRMTADSRRVSKYAREAIERNPEMKECQWLLQKADGASIWDWNISNHTTVIDFYKKVIENDHIEPKTPLPYYEVMDNLIADHRTKEAAEYLEVYKTLPAHKPFLVPIYQASIALAEYDKPKADTIMEEAEEQFRDHPGFLFEKAQYHARNCEYARALEYYEKSWELDEKPRFTDALQGIAIIYEILDNTQKALETYDRMIVCIKEEWNYTDDDAAVIEAEREKKRLQKG